MKYSIFLALIIFSSLVHSQTILELGEPELSNDVWNIKQYKRAKDMSNRKDTEKNQNMDWDRWLEWKRIKGETMTKSTLGEWMNFGPDTASGRIISITFHPTDSNTFYVGAASGGLWRTEDYGNTWSPLTDEYPSMAIGAVGINPLDPSKIIIVTGEGYLHGAEMTYGIGVLISEDEGTTWNTTNITANLGQSFAGMDVYWSKTDTSKVCIASTYGVLYSSDGGNNFSLSLGVLPSRMVSSPQCPDTLYLTARYYNTSLQGGLYRSYDAGQTWTQLAGNGLPNPSNIGFSSIAVHSTYSNIIYVNISESMLNGIGPSVGLYKSSDYGNTFTYISSTSDILCDSVSGYSYCLGWYANTILISYDDTNTIYGGSIHFWKSTNGGIDWNQIDTLNNGTYAIHVDHHQTVFHPITGDIFDCHDGGVSYSKDEGANWISISDGLITYQYYSIAVSELDPGLVIGGTQDMGILYSSNVHSPNTWNYKSFGDAFSTVINHDDPDIWYTTVYPLNGRLISVNAGANWYIINNGITEDAHWRLPLTMHPNVSTTLLTCSDTVIYKTTNGIDWAPKSYNDFLSSTITYDKVNPDIVYANSQANNNLYISIDGGENWTALPASPGFPVTDIECDPLVSGKIYISVGSFSSQNQLFVSNDFGVNWTNISNNLPDVPANTVVIDPFNTSHIYIGNDLGVWFSDNSGTSWDEFNCGLPYVAVEDMHYLKADTTIRIGTYGRGYWESKAVDPNLSSDIPENTNKGLNIKLFPNPANNKVSLLGLLKDMNTEIMLYDINGCLIEDIEAKGNTIDLTKLPDGVYVVKITSDLKNWTGKIIKQ